LSLSLSLSLSFVFVFVFCLLSFVFVFVQDKARTRQGPSHSYKEVPANLNDRFRAGSQHPELRKWKTMEIQYSSRIG
jgi:hypothetical protein